MKNGTRGGSQEMSSAKRSAPPSIFAAIVCLALYTILTSTHILCIYIHSYSSLLITPLSIWLTQHGRSQAVFFSHSCQGHWCTGPCLHSCGSCQHQPKELYPLPHAKYPIIKKTSITDSLSMNSGMPDTFESGLQHPALMLSHPRLNHVAPQGFQARQPLPTTPGGIYTNGTAEVNSGWQNPFKAQGLSQ